MVLRWEARGVMAGHFKYFLQSGPSFFCLIVPSPNSLKFSAMAPLFTFHIILVSSFISKFSFP